MSHSSRFPWFAALARWRAIPALLLAAGLALGAGAVLADHGSPFINLTIADNVVTHNGAKFVQGGIGAGTGNFDPFLTVNAGGNATTEQGYNTTSANGEFDTFFGGGRTHPLKASAVPALEVGGTLYREFLLDYNETGSEDFVAIDVLKFYLDNQNNLTDYTDATSSFGSDTGTSAALIYNMDAGGDTVLLMCTQSCSSGSGVSDISVLLPDTLFPANCYYGSTTCDKWIYLYFAAGGYVEGSLGTDPVAGSQNWGVTGGFEEWRTELVPVVNVTKTANVSYTQPYDWTLTKQVSLNCATPWVDAASVAIEVGSSQDYCWRLVATRVPGAPTGQTISGTITITNPTGGDPIADKIPANVTSIVDSINFDDATPDFASVTVNCPQTLPFTLAAGASITCTYSQATGGSATTTGTNTVTVVVEDAGTDFVATANFNFASATVNLYDESATFSDPEVPAANGQTVTGPGPFPFQSGTLSHLCGSTTTIVNSALLTETDSGTPRTDSAQITINCVDAQVDLSPLTDSNEVNDAHTITATVQQNDGLPAGPPGDSVTGFGPAPNGTLVTFSLVNNTAGAAFVGGVNTCTTTSGSCSVQINTSTAGGVDIHTTTTFSVLGVSLTRSTGTGGLNSADAHKDWVKVRISISPLTDDNEAGTNHVLTITLQYSVVEGTWLALNGETVTAAIAANDDGATASFVGSPSCVTAGAGQCTVTINSPTAGSTTVEASWAGGTVAGASITAKTTEPDADKDWVKVRIAISPLTDDNEAGTNHVLTITLQKSVVEGVWTALNGQTVTAAITANDDGATAAFVGSPSCVTAGAGQCTVTINSPTAGSTTIEANWAGGTVEGASITAKTTEPDADKDWVKVRISIAPDGTNFIYSNHVLTITLQYSVVEGTWLALNGQTVTASLTNSAGATAAFVGSPSCLTAGAGQCTVTINSPTTGTTVVEASWAGGVVAGATITSKTTEPDATKTWIAGQVILNKTFQDGPFTHPGQACFTLSRVPTPPPPVSSDAAVQCGTGTSLSFTWDDLVAGAYTITETTVPAGYVAMTPITFTVDATNRNFTFSRNDPLQPGDLRLLKQKGTGAGPAAWDGPNVTLYVCANTPPGNSTEKALTDCDSAGEAVAVVTLTAAQPSATVTNLAEGYYTVCESPIPSGYTIPPADQCQVVAVVAGQTGSSANQITFVNSPPTQGCTPGFWQGGLGATLWNTVNDPDWTAHGGAGTNPFIHTTKFNDFFTPVHPTLNNVTMYDLVSSGGGSDLVVKTARVLVASYLNSAFGLNNGYTTSQLQTLWTAFVNGGKTDTSLFNALTASTQLGCPIN